MAFWTTGLVKWSMGSEERQKGTHPYLTSELEVALVIVFLSLRLQGVFV